VNSAGSSSAARQAMNEKFNARPGDRDSSVGIETRCGLDWPGVVGQSGRDFPHPSRSAHEQGAPGLFP
jgi:hypothetical protein